MTPFKDGKGDSRQLSLNVFTLEKIRSSVKDEHGEPIDLMKVGDEMGRPGGTLEKLTTNPFLLCQVIHVAIGGDFDEFCQAMNGDGIANATEALILEIVDFFPRSRRPAMKLAVEKAKNLEQTIADRALALVDSETFDQALEKSLFPASATPSGA